MLKDFKAFAVKGNVLDMAVGIIIGAAFGKIVNSLVSDILMPPLGLVLGNVDFSNIFLVLKNGKTPPPYASLAEAQTAGAVSVNAGVFINTLVSFVIVAFAVFLLVRGVARLERKKDPEVTTRECPFCTTSIAKKATRCPQCTSQVDAVA
jgi:large conductance mechanosensitive channel